MDWIWAIFNAADKVNKLKIDFILKTTPCKVRRQKNKNLRMDSIREVWASNFEREMLVIEELIDKYPYVSMDTEFPGIVARPIGTFKNSCDYTYQTLRVNVDLLKIIQLGLTLSDEDGNLCPNVHTWQFNFKFSLSVDMYAQESIDLLSNSGIDFAKHEEFGIDVEHFGSFLF